MTKTIANVLAALVLGGTLLAAPAVSLANKGDCGQPSSSGATPVTSDAQTILKESVGQDTACDPILCKCDVNSTTNSPLVTTSDALLVLKKAVGQPVTLNCNNCVGGVPCTSAEFLSRTGSDLDSGWTGLAHNSDLILGASITFRTMRRCSDNQAQCVKDSDCGNNDCVPTCDCNNDTSCEITGPTQPKHCLTTTTDCTTNADCPVGVACSSLFGPPLPLSSGGTPVCVLSVFDGPLTGTADSATGEALTASNLKSRVFLGISLGQPCPRCGVPSSTLKVGDVKTCEGGQFPGATCTVDGVSPVFGGTSFDCPPDLGANISGSGLAIRFAEVTTGTTTKTAQLPCANFAFKANPLNAPTNPGKCLDDNSACTSNADCKRCTGDSTVACTSNANCTGKGTCAESPDQPISCGYWCNCGFCDGNASLPCFQNGDCPDGQLCKVGPGTGTQQNAPQQKPNDCSGDKFICGQDSTETCATTLVGKCSEQTYRNCNDDSTCITNDAGLCLLEQRPCFEPRITRTGEPSPLGKYCAFEVKACTTNADCTGTDDFCANDSSRPETVALFCVPATSSSSINNAGGITGPGAVRLNGFIQVCRCGDGKIGCDEQCDDGNTNNGDGCSDYCQNE